MDAYFQNIVDDHNKIVGEFFEKNQDKIYELVDHCEQRLRNGGKFLVFGNGGSASDSSHFVGELVGRFEKERKGIAAVALAADSVNVTAIGNDYGYHSVFERQVDALAKDNDILLGISTSGFSPNVLNALAHTRKINVNTVNILLTSQRLPEANSDDLLKNDVDYIFKVPHNNTARIQETHIIFLHVLAQLIENKFS